MRQNVTTPSAGIPPDCDGLAEKLALLHLRLFTRHFSKHATVCSGPISACANTPEGVSTGYRVFVLLSMRSGETYLRLKPYLVVQISSDIVTEHCCQVCVLFMMFCRSDCRLCADMVVSDCAIRNSSLYRVVWHSDRPTWDMKNIICIWFSHFI